MSEDQADDLVFLVGPRYLVRQGVQHDLPASVPHGCHPSPQLGFESPALPVRRHERRYTVDRFDLDEVQLIVRVCGHEELRPARSLKRGFHLEEEPPLEAQHREDQKFVQPVHRRPIVAPAFAKEYTTLGVTLGCSVYQAETTVQRLTKQGRMFVRQQFRERPAWSGELAGLECPGEGQFRRRNHRPTHRQPATVRGEGLGSSCMPLTQLCIVARGRGVGPLTVGSRPAAGGRSGSNAIR